LFEGTYFTSNQAQLDPKFSEQNLFVVVAFLLSFDNLKMRVRHIQGEIWTKEEQERLLQLKEQLPFSRGQGFIRYVSSLHLYPFVSVKQRGVEKSGTHH
jgi:hypothetical protein